MNELLLLKFKSGLSYEQLSERSGLAKSVIHRIFTGQSNPTIETALKLCVVMNISIEEFIGALGYSIVMPTPESEPESEPKPVTAKAVTG